ncbi:ABC transporter B member 29, chloroplastic [Ancistrocladus abbreviatus]
MAVCSTPKTSSSALIQPLHSPTLSFYAIRNPNCNRNSKRSTTFIISVKISPKSLFNRSNFIKLSSKPPPISSTAKSSPLDSLSRSISSLNSIKPYLQSQWKPILQGWTFSVISVFSLSKIIPKSGKISAILNDFDAISGEGLGLAILVLVRLVANYLQQAFLWEAALNSVYKIRVYVFEKVLQRDLRFFEGGDDVLTGDIAYRITAEGSDVADTVFALLNTAVPSTLQLSAMAAQILVISPGLSLISALVIPSMVLVMTYLGERLREISGNAHISIAVLSAYLNEVLLSIFFVKASNSEWSESVRFNRLAHANLTKQLKKKKMKALIPQIVQAIYFGSLFAFCGASLVLSGRTFDFGTLISFITSLIFLIEPIQGVGKAYNEWKQGEPAIDRLFDLARFEPGVINKPDAIDIDSVSGEVKFCDVSFQYRDDLPPVLDGICLHIKAGETVALVGPSGGGKTTLIKLLLRLYDPLCGCIFIDDFNIKDIQLESLRRHVGLVSQDIILFSGTVAENIGYKDLRTEIDMERVEHVAKIANADEFIRTLPNGYETNVGPRGSMLSGGQKQRLAIARALYQNPSILVLDEATSALDSRSELLVREALERVMKNVTVLIIAHRLETVLMAKRVFCLNNGRLEEISQSSLVGGHRELLASAGLVI